MISPVKLELFLFVTYLGCLHTTSKSFQYKKKSQVFFLFLFFSTLNALKNVNPLTAGVYLKVIHTLTDLQLKVAGLFKYVLPFSGHDQSFKGLKGFTEALTPFRSTFTFYTL